MMKTSAGRLPAHLVIIFFMALALTVLCGVFLQFAERIEQKNSVYLSERLSPDRDKAVIAESQLTGTWVSVSGDYVSMLRMGKGNFELIIRYKSSPVSRYFVRGGYRIDGNVLIMQERQDLGTPLDLDHLEYKFYPMTLGAVNLYAETDGRAMIWNTPSAERGRIDNPEPVIAQIFGERTEWIKASATP